MASFVFDTRITRNLGLKGNEALVFALIHSFSQDNSGTFFGSTVNWSKELGVTRQALTNVLDRLMEKGFIMKSDGCHQGTMTYDYVTTVDLEGVKKFDMSRNFTGDVKKVDTPNSINNNYNLSISDNKDYNINKHTLNAHACEKIKFAEFVSLTQEEYDRLLQDYGEADLKWMIAKLDNYKGQQKKNHNKYVDDNRVLRGWVADALADRKLKESQAAQRGSYNRYGRTPEDIKRQEEISRRIDEEAAAVLKKWKEEDQRNERN